MVLAGQASVVLFLKQVRHRPFTAANAFYREAVTLHSPGSRTERSSVRAPWVAGHKGPLSPCRGETLVAPLRGAEGAFGNVTQGALRDPGLWSFTPAAWSAGPPVATPALPHRNKTDKRASSIARGPPEFYRGQATITTVAPLRGAEGAVCSVTQGALRDPGLWSFTPSAWSAGPPVATPGQPHRNNA
jgi:hypothetical protein